MAKLSDLLIDRESLKPFLPTERHDLINKIIDAGILTDQEIKLLEFLTNTKGNNETYYK